ncbi:hypothetical protein BC567DRAFT_42276 [Phyllosticta citribraziliensis]
MNPYADKEPPACSKCVTVDSERQRLVSALSFKTDNVEWAPCDEEVVTWRVCSTPPPLKRKAPESPPRWRESLREEHSDELGATDSTELFAITCGQGSSASSLRSADAQRSVVSLSVSRPPVATLSPLDTKAPPAPRPVRLRCGGWSSQRPTPASSTRSRCCSEPSTATTTGPMKSTWLTFSTWASPRAARSTS